jgi:hypothetical protein
LTNPRFLALAAIIQRASAFMGDFMRRFSIMATVAAGLLAIGSLARGGERNVAPGASRRPNILFLLGDDWAWPHACCLGYAAIKTPTFDRLACEGVLFRNAHCAAPSCSPSRAAMLTG